MINAANLTPTQQHLHAAHKARQARFDAAARKVRQDPKNERVRLIAANSGYRSTREWENGDISFDDHIQTYRRWLATSQSYNGCPYRQFIHQVSAELGFDYENIVGKTNTDPTKIARGQVALRLKTTFGLAHAHIARLLNRHPSTIRHIIGTAMKARGE